MSLLGCNTSFPFSLPCLLLPALLCPMVGTCGRAGCPIGLLPQRRAQKIKCLVQYSASGSCEGAAPGVPILFLKATAGREQKERWKGYTCSCQCSWSVICPQWHGNNSRVTCPLLLGAHLGSTQRCQQPWPRLQRFPISSFGLPAVQVFSEIRTS